MQTSPINGGLRDGGYRGFYSETWDVKIETLSCQKVDVDLSPDMIEVATGRSVQGSAGGLDTHFRMGKMEACLAETTVK